MLGQNTPMDRQVTYFWCSDDIHFLKCSVLPFARKTLKKDDRELIHIEKVNQMVI